MIRFRANTKSAELSLPMGIYLKKHDQTFDTVTVSGMDGDDEESISEKRIKNNGAKVITQLLAKKIIKVGSFDFPDGIGETIAKDMFTEDRDACLVKIRELMSDEMPYTAKCPVCGAEHEGVASMSAILKKCKHWGDNEDLHDESLPLGVIEFTLPDGLVLVDDDPDSAKELICKKGKIRLPNGAIEENIVQGSMNNTGKANTLLLTACILEIENIRKVDQYVVKAMSRADREYLNNLISDAKCGPELLENIICVDCDNKFKFMLQLPYFFTTGRNQM